MPIKTEEINNHQMYEEEFFINPKVAKKLNEFKKQGRRIIAVGTTVVRALESAIRQNKIKSVVGKTNLFIKPGYKFKFIDGMITNFHLPRSTNLILISVLGGPKNISRIYQEAIKRRYRFYSFGDALLII